MARVRLSGPESGRTLPKPKIFRNLFDAAGRGEIRNVASRASREHVIQR